MARQRTVAAPFCLEGVGLHTGANVKLEVRPAPADSGVVFVRTDLPGEPRVEASVVNLDGPPRRTALSCGGASVQTVEHLMATLYALEVQNAEVRLDGPEVPGMDGSALPFYEAVQAAGIEELDAAARQIHLAAPIALTERDSSVIACQRAEGLSLTYTLDYDQSYVPTQHLSVVVDPEVFGREIAPARTFVLAEEARALQAAGLGKGANTGNTLVIGEDGILDNELRFEDEFVRHKLLDLIGDLALASGQIHARVLATKSGHSLNRQLARSIAENLEPRRRAAAAADGKHPSGVDLRNLANTLPHRYPFLLVDRVLEISDDGLRGTGIKNVSFNEEYFQGHFPGNPVMPGVLQIEALAQLAGVLLLTHDQYKGRLAYILSIDRVKFRRPVVPGDQLVLEAEVNVTKSRTAQVSTRARVDGAVVAEAEIRFMMQR